MTTIKGRLNEKITGKIVATPDVPFSVEGSNEIVILPKEKNIGTISEPSDEFEIVVSQSESVLVDPSDSGFDGYSNLKGVTYKWQVIRFVPQERFFFLDGTLYEGERVARGSEGWWSGKKYVEGESRPLTRLDSPLEKILIEFHAIAPKIVINSGTGQEEPVNFTELVGINHQSPTLDLNLLRLADILTQPPYRDRISSRLAIKGEWDANESYVVTDTVFYKGSSYIYINPTTDQTTSKGKEPPSIESGEDNNWRNEYWQFVTLKGQDGSGTTAVYQKYEEEAWKAIDNLPPTRKGVTEGISNLREQTLEIINGTLTGFAPINSPDFTGVAKLEGSPVINQIALGSALSSIVRDVISVPYAYGISQISSGFMSKGFPIVVNLDTKVLIGVNNDRINDYERSIGQGKTARESTIVIDKDGWFLFFCSALLSVKGRNNTLKPTQIKGALATYPDETEIGILFQETRTSFAEEYPYLMQGYQMKKLKKGDEVAFVVGVDGDGLADSNTAKIGVGSTDKGFNTFVVVWRFDKEFNKLDQLPAT
ncbi:MAG: hypothetical protein F6J98_02035 [Moorea sp. SIO4G2]|nr:hypothetical protein [Moorena sp. SIO4G2]